MVLISNAHISNEVLLLSDGKTDSTGLSGDVSIIYLFHQLKPCFGVARQSHRLSVDIVSMV